MNLLVLLIPFIFLLTACSPKPIIVQNPKEFELPDQTIRSLNHPTCDRHPYIYGFDEKGTWRSNGCSREYIKENDIPYQDQLKMKRRSHGN